MKKIKLGIIGCGLAAKKLREFPIPGSGFLLRQSFHCQVIRKS